MARQSEKVGIQTRVGRDGVRRYRGTAYDKRAGKALRGPWTTSFPAARSWRIDALNRIDKGTMSGERGMKVAEAVDEFLAGIKDGSIRNRSGRRYKPSVIRDYERDLKRRLERHLGANRLREVELPEIQIVADRLRADGLSASSVRNTVMALRALYGWAIPRGYATMNPCVGLKLPIDDAQARERIASPQEAALLVGALTGRDRTALALALYAGLRAGELLALDWSNVDLDERGAIFIDPERGAWDHGGQTFIAPKSKAAVRMVPIIARLEAILLDHADQFGSEGLLLPNMRTGGDTPMSHSALVKRLRKRWEAVNKQTRKTAAREGRKVADGELLEPLGLHEGRHTFASMMIEAMKRSRALNPKALCTFMGHSSITVTYDRYGHLMPGTEIEVRGLMDSYLEAS